MSALKSELAQHWHANPNLNFLPFQTSRAKQTLLVNFWKTPAVAVAVANEKLTSLALKSLLFFDVIARKERGNKRMEKMQECFLKAEPTKHHITTNKSWRQAKIDHETNGRQRAFIFPDRMRAFIGTSCLNGLEFLEIPKAERN